MIWLDKEKGVEEMAWGLRLASHTLLSKSYASIRDYDRFTCARTASKFKNAFLCAVFARRPLQRALIDTPPAAHAMDASTPSKHLLRSGKTGMMSITCLQILRDLCEAFDCPFALR